jgi:EAL domain-containing protein (putative c-di-GMP-specific phosphodiesterase class I)
MTNNVALHFQPIVQAQNQQIPAFYEGLIRVLDDTGRIIPAREFISTIESSAEGRQIDCLALTLALKSLRDIPSLRLSINMSVQSIGHAGWLEALNRGLHNTPKGAERLIIEITEASAFEDPDLISNFMADLNLLGCAFALDDFGAGQTSFRYFKDFFFDIVKIDGSFIRGIHKDADNQVLTEALVMIAKQFDMFTVAEYVESARDAEYLTNAGVHCLQGYLFGAPAVTPRMPRLMTGRLTA